MTHWFNKVAYTQVVLGVIAYAVAEQNPAMVLAAGALSTLSWYVVEGPAGKPIPRPLINLGVLAATGWLFYTQMPPPKIPLIIGLGQFILCIQLFKLYEKKANRDWAQLLVLSLMQMICASIISAEVVYGVLLGVYLLLSLASILLFQLKLGYDEAARAAAKQTPPGQATVLPRAVSSRGALRHFNSAAILSGATCLSIATVVFIAMPRGEGVGVLGDWQTPSHRPVSGFDTKVQLGSGHIATSRAPVMNVKLIRDGRVIGSREMVFLMRGSAMDDYDTRSHRWVRSPAVSRFDVSVQSQNGQALLVGAKEARSMTALKQVITLRAPTRGVLLGAYPPLEVTCDPVRSLTFSAYDQVITAHQPLPGSFQYTVYSATDTPEVAAAYRDRWGVPESKPAPPPHHSRHGGHTFDWSSYARGPVVRDARIASLTRSIMKAAGLHRDPAADSDPSDGAIAAVVRDYLQTNCSYTLDLPEVPAGTDPISAFLFDTRRGHCEYFASAMAAMLRSVGVRCRVVTGLRACEFNSVGGYYVVRQQNAHAWVEAWVGGTWTTFDPSPQIALNELQLPQPGLLASLRDMYEYLEFQWINNVITYDDAQRTTVMFSIDHNLSGIGEQVSRAAQAVRAWVRGVRERWTLGVAGWILVGTIGGAILCGLTLLLRIVVRRRRAIRQLQLDAVSRRDQRRLAQNLEFYLNMLKVLERAGHSKPVWQTPAHFAAKLLQGDPQRFTPVVQLTDLFYEIRFGGRPLDITRARTIQQHLDRLRQSL